MANAQLMQDELQQSVVLSEEDAEFEADLPHDTMMVDDDIPQPPGNMGESPYPPGEYAHHDVENYDNQDENEVDMGPVDDMGLEDEEEGELGDQPVEDDELDQEDDESSSEEDIHDDDDAAFDIDVDAEGEDDEDIGARQINPNAAFSDEDDAEHEAAEDDDENEGVGAVKIKPGDTEDEESDSEDDISLASGSSDRESTAEWEEAVDNDDEEEEEEEEEESDVVDPNNCIFCKKHKDHYPAEEFGAYLSCKSCGEHAHQQCARAEGALSTKNNASNWKCPDCAADDASNSEAEFGRENMGDDQDMEMEGGVDSDLSPTSASRSTAHKLTRDLLPSQRGVNKPDSHSMFNQLVLDEDPLDGSRVLRKRKTSSAEAEEDVMSLRKRRKNTSESIQDDVNQEKANAAEVSTRPRSVRSLRHKASNLEALCTVIKKSRSSLVVKMRVDAARLQKILHIPRSQRKRSNRATASRASRSSRNVGSTRAAAVAEPLPMAPFFPSSYSQPFYSFYDKEPDELKGKPYGGILTEEQADTTKTLPTKDDRRRFDEAKQKAEEEWRNRLLAMQAEAEVPVKKSRKASGPASQIECIEFGGWEIDTWYAAPYPEEYSRNRVLYICEFCLKYMNSDYVAWRHKLKCPAKHPPGDEIYRHGSISFFEVDGRKNPVYCQNLCLLAKLFLGSKTLYYDVEPFLFYVLCEYDDLGYHFVGYFSKEKRASSQNNVSCILTLPIHQRKGYGHLLIDFSYLLTKVEEKTGSPEKPLSDMGLVSYRNYWRLVICKYLIDHMPEDKSQKKGLSIRQISDETGMTPDDVISALEALRFLVRDPVTQVYAFRVDLAYCHKEVAKWEAKNYVKLNPKNLTWMPYVMGRSNATNFELGPALNTIAPREEDEEVKAVQTLAESGIATGDFAITQPADQKPSLGSEPSVLESTEPNDNAVTEGREDIKVNGIGKENTEAPGVHSEDPRASTGAAVSAPDDENAWLKPYESIPPSRFQVFPPINNRRTAMSRLNSTISRPPPLPRIPPPSARRAARPKARRSTTGTSARKTAPKASSGKRKPGGTGRGPGRWPKGTKKSDYGNADSGPGLPPAWIERQRQAALAAANAVDDNDTLDTVQVQVSEGGKSQSQKGKQTIAMATKFEVTADGAPAEGSALPDGVGVGADVDVDVDMGGVDENTETVTAGAEDA